MCCCESRLILYEVLSECGARDIWRHGTLVSHRIIPAVTASLWQQVLTPHPGPERRANMDYSSHSKLHTVHCRPWPLTVHSLLLRMWHRILQDDFSDELTVHQYTQPTLCVILWIRSTGPNFSSVLYLHPDWHPWPHYWQDVTCDCRRGWPGLLLQCSSSPAWNFYEIGWS